MKVRRMHVQWIKKMLNDHQTGRFRRAVGTDTKKAFEKASDRVKRTVYRAE